uniref:Uncharacterized protein n=1 Tax=Rhizophora mucronata TaxID=61149 RepID=A0A2P2P520_RHIMU
MVDTNVFTFGCNISLHKLLVMLF